jgi:hypothetical protein
MPAHFPIFARRRATKRCLKIPVVKGVENKKAGANAGPLQPPCKIDQ